MAVLGDVADARRRASRAGCVPVTSSPPTTIWPALGVRRPVIASISSLWPLASTPARPTISPARTCRSRPRTAGRPRSSTRVEVADLEQRLARLVLGPSRPAAARRGRPSAAPGCARSAPSVGTVSIFLPRRRTVTRSAIVEHLVELVRDEDDRRPLRRQRAQDLEQVLRLLRGQHRGRLVEDQHLGAAEQRAQDLDALLLRRRRGPRPGASGRPRARSARTARATRRPAALWSSSGPLRGSAPSTRFSATVMTGTSMKCWWTMPMPSPIASPRRSRS